MRHDLIEQTENFVRHELGDDATGHDWYHIERVRRNALNICSEENEGNTFIIEMAALLHDIPDEKLNDSAEKGAEKLESFLATLDMSDEAKIHIKNIIFTISFKGGVKSELDTIEAKIVQDADRLDAIGAIGIARAFAFGGKKGQPIYDPDLAVREKMTIQEYRKGKSSSVNHFYEKLLKLKEKMNTKTASRMAEERHKRMEQFLEQFYSEWNGQS
ncbi:MAG: HD domain-containing protein [Bacillota bacterium]|nr:HD domain-containing protein [Bacillota bacterium]MDP4171112.1 HD domain-containing protein [Bacillota bacterium]